MKIRTLLLLAALSFAASTAQAAPIQSGAPGQNFSCDVNTGYCTCTGSIDGADCKGMWPNCKLTRPDGTIWSECTIGKGCTCRMFRTVPGGQSKALPPIMWMWRWSTVWPPQRPTFDTSR